MIVHPDQVAKWLRFETVDELPRPLMIRVYRPLADFKGQIVFWADWRKPLAVLLAREQKILCTAIACTPNGVDWLRRYDEKMAEKGGEVKWQENETKVTAVDDKVT